MEDNSASFIQLHRDDSGYGSPILNHEFLSPKQSSSSYYSYQHNYHPHMAYSNNSFHMYDQLIGIIIFIIVSRILYRYIRK
jgi:hypothetical protein